MITLEEYVGPHTDSPDWTSERKANAEVLLLDVNALLEYLTADIGVEPQVNPKTGSQVSGTTFGGFRPQDCCEGAPDSSHRDGSGVDVYDPQGYLDDALNNTLLEKYGLYREHPSATPGWLHLTKRAPRSGNRSFYP